MEYEIAPSDALTAAQAQGMLGVGSSGFYRLLESEEKEGRPVKRYRVSKRTFVYDNAAIRALRERIGAKPARKKGRPSREKQISSAIVAVEVRDLAAINFMENREQLQLGHEYEGVAPASRVARWLSKNPDLYWMMCDLKTRNSPEPVIYAVLGVLPLRSADLALKLLRRELFLEDLSADDIEVYEQGKEYVCYISSMTTLPSHKDALLVLMQQAWDYWKQHNIRVRSIYIHAPYEKPKTVATAALHLVSHYFPVRLDGFPDEQAAWELRVDVYNPQALVQDYQQFLEKQLEKQKAGVNMIIAPTRSKRSALLETEEEAAKKVHDLGKLAQRQLQISEDGHLIDHRGVVIEHIRFRRIETEDDIRATIRINASHFGSSKRYTEDQLVDQRKAFLARNIDTYRVLEDHSEVKAFINAFPLPWDIIRRNLTGEMKLSDVDPEEVLEYTPDAEPVDIYHQTMGIHSDITGALKGQVGHYLIRATLSMINEFGKRGIRIRSLYTLSEKSDGMRLLRNFGFERCDNILNEESLVYRLDFSNEENPFLIEYHSNLRAYQVRQALNPQSESSL